MEETPLINRVAESSLKTINLEHFYPKQEFIDFDLKPYLFHGLILKEKRDPFPPLVAPISTKNR